LYGTFASHQFINPDHLANALGSALICMESKQRNKGFETNASIYNQDMATYQGGASQIVG